MGIRDYLKQISYVDIIILIFLAISIYELYKSYNYNKEFNDKFITKTGDFDYKLDNYKKSQLYKRYIALNDDDKEFLEDYIVYVYLNNKENRPEFPKKIKTARNQLILSTLLGSYLLKTPLIKIFRQNVMSYVIANII